MTYAFFHHVLPAMKSKANAPSKPSPIVSTTPSPELPQLTPQPSAEPEVEATPAPVDNRTEWQKKFEDKFTAEVVQTENSYSSPTISVSIETVSTGEGDNKITYHVADIYIASMDNFITYTANNELRYFSTQDALEMDKAANAIIAISGDFYSYQSSGLLMRNGVLYMSDYTYCDICVMYKDGRIETYGRGEYDIDTILAAEPVQIWNFGPSLLDSAGQVKTNYNVSTTVSYPNPRSAIGYYEPGHYCFVVVDGRQQGYSKGMTIPELAQIFADLGCTNAYNLDGGGSALMTFNHEKYSQQSNGGDRMLGDILVITEQAPENLLREGSE